LGNNNIVNVPPREKEKHLTRDIVTAQVTRGAAKKETSESPPTQVTAPNGIAISGGVVNNPTVNNFGPPPPPKPTVTICISRPPATDASHTVVMTFKTDVAITEPYYVLYFDGPVGDGTADSPSGAYGFLKSRAKDSLESSFAFKLTSINFGAGRWLPSQEIKVTVPSKNSVRFI
jgi:hypothetical protein